MPTVLRSRSCLSYCWGIVWLSIAQAGWLAGGAWGVAFDLFGDAGMGGVQLGAPAVGSIASA